MRDFKTLKVWEKAHQLTLQIYKLTASFPKDEMFGLTSQMRRSSASIPANIAEGCGRATDNELAHFLQIAMGSASELEYHLLLAHDLHFILMPIYAETEQHLIEVKRMLNAFIQKLRNKSG